MLHSKLMYDINMLKNIKFGTVPESMIKVSEQVLC